MSTLRKVTVVMIALLLSGIGANDPLSVPVGLVQVVGNPGGLPFSQALFQMTRVPD